MIKDFEDQATFEATLQGLPDASWTVQDLLRCLTSMATSVKVGAGDTIRACMQRGLDPQALGFGDPHWQRGVGARIDKAVDVLREKLAAPDAETPAPQWQPIETAPKEQEVLFWVVPKLPEESYQDSSGKPIYYTTPAGYIHRGKSRTWSSLSKATHWMPLPDPPAVGDAAASAKGDIS